MEKVSDQMQQEISTGAVAVNLACKGLWVIEPNGEFSIYSTENDPIKCVSCE